jgi:hypothetical protein
MRLGRFWPGVSASCIAEAREDETMAADAGKQSKRSPLKARPQTDVDRKKLRADISERFSETLEYLAK